MGFPLKRVEWTKKDVKMYLVKDNKSKERVVDTFRRHGIFLSSSLPPSPVQQWLFEASVFFSIQTY